MDNRINAQKASALGNGLFFAAVMLALLSGAFAVTAKNELTLILGLVFCGVFLALGCVAVFLCSRRAGRFAALAKEKESVAAAEKAAWEKANLESFAEDGLPGAFCREIRGYSPAQLRLILDEQVSEYTPEEFAFIEKVLAEKAGVQ